MRLLSNNYKNDKQYIRNPYMEVHKHPPQLIDKNKWEKSLFLCGCFLFLLLQVSAQTYTNIDSARKLTGLSSPEERFRGLRTLDRYYYTTGLFDSSELAEKEMLAIAKKLKRDTMMAIVYRAIGNKYVVKTDYNFSIINYAKGLEYTGDYIQMRAGLYLNLAYVYIATGNNNVALDYIQRGRSIGQVGQNLYFENLLYGIICNNLDKPDSALYYFRQAENLPVKINDPLLNAVFLQQTGRAHELTGDTGLAEAFIKKRWHIAGKNFFPCQLYVRETHIVIS